MNQTATKNEVIKLCFIAFPTLLLAFTAEYFVKERGIAETVYAGILGGVGTLMGLLAFKVVHHKSLYIKLITLVMLISGIIFLIRIIKV